MFNKIKSHAKINLALNIIGKSKSLHKIESIIAFLELHDEIYIKKNEKFKEISNIIINNVPEDNGELLKEFIRKRVEYKFGSANG